MADRKVRAGRKIRSPKLTRIEKLTKGLLTDRSENDIFAVKEVPDKGRGVFLRIAILRKDSFVLEYKGDIISEAEARYRERIYAHNNEGCFIMSFVFQGTKLAVDATRQFDSFGRLLNHSREPNVKFHPPFMIDLKGGLPRIASYALRDIYKGEEIVIDYGVRDGHISWLRNREIGFTADVDSDSSDNSDCTDPDNSQANFQSSGTRSENRSSAGHAYQDIDVISDVTSTARFSRGHSDKQFKQNFINNCGISFSEGIFGLRFTPVVPGAPTKTFFAGFEDIGCPQKILRFIEDPLRKKKQRLDSDSVICLSTSSSGSSKISESSASCAKNTYPCSSSQASIRTSNIELPSNKAPDSIHKVLEWQIDSSSQDSTMDIKIVGIQSLSDSPFVEESSEYKSESSSLSSFSLSMVTAPTFSKSLAKKITSFERSDVYVVSDDECLAEAAISDKQLKSVTEKDLTAEECSDDMSSSSDCEIILTDATNPPEIIFTGATIPPEIIFTDPTNSSSEPEKLGSNLPVRRPLGFSPSSVQPKVAVIKPYLTPVPRQLRQRDPDSMTDSELDQLKIIFRQHIVSNKSSYDEVQQAIFRNWDFFSVLIQRGVSINQIRSTFNNFFKKRD